MVLALGEKTAVQAVVGSIVWAFRKLKKPRCRVMSARGYALHSVCPQLFFQVEAKQPAPPYLDLEPTISCQVVWFEWIQIKYASVMLPLNPYGIINVIKVCSHVPQNALSVVTIREIVRQGRGEHGLESALTN